MNLKDSPEGEGFRPIVETIMLRLRFESCVKVLAFLLTLVRSADSFATTTIVGDGGDLVSAVASAANGDVIEIHSNDVFVGTLSWGDKCLTIQAGLGFHPTIKGTSYELNEPEPLFGYPAIQTVAGTLGTGGTIRGLRLEYGEYSPNLPPDDVPVNPHQFPAVAIGTTGMRWSNMSFYDNEMAGMVALSGTGDFTIESVFENNRFFSPLLLGGTGRLSVGARAEHNMFHAGVSVGGTGEARANLSLHNNYLIPSEESAPLATGIRTLSNGRHRSEIVATNNVIVGNDRVGIQMEGESRSSATGRFVNNTVVGFDTGISIGTNSLASFENMLLHNADDIDLLMNSSIRNSLISDGTSAGVNGNFGGIPQLGSRYQLLPGSIGIDAGNNGAMGLQRFDILGRPRILDGNRDGVLRVDVGAYELVPEPAMGWLMLVAVGAVVAVRDFILRRRAGLPLAALPHRHSAVGAGAAW